MVLRMRLGNTLLVTLLAHMYALSEICVMAVTEVASRRLLSLGACCLSWFYTNFSHLFLWQLLFRSHNPILLFCFLAFLFFSFFFFFII